MLSDKLIGFLLCVIFIVSFSSFFSVTDDDDEDDRTASLESNSYSTQEQSSRLLLARLNQMDISSLDREFVGFLNNYVTALMESDFNASSMKDMPQLKTMMEHLGRPLKK